MPNTVEVANVTRRLKSDNVRLMSDARVTLLASLDDQKKVNLFFAVYCDTGVKLKHIDTYEVDTVLDVSELPQPSGNKQQWERVRVLIQQNDKLSLDEAWLQIAVSNAAHKWKFSMEENTETSFCFSITTPKRSTPLEARVEDGNFFIIE